MKNKHGNRWMIILLCCTLAVPTVACLMGAYTDGFSQAQMTSALAVGALLGLAHILLRPALRLLFAPIGCLTLGLFGIVIDIGLLYACDALVEGFAVPGLLYALLTAFTINAVCAVAAGRH